MSTPRPAPTHTLCQSHYSGCQVRHAQEVVAQLGCGRIGRGAVSRVSTADQELPPLGCCRCTAAPAGTPAQMQLVSWDETSHPLQHIGRVLEDYSYQVKDLQRRLNESNELYEKQKLYLRQSVIDLETKLKEMEVERDAMVHELEAAKCLKEHKLKGSSAQSDKLRKMMLSHEGVLQEI
ncbi:hypothetical protein MC885_014301 [Smutsia gigantea]|nr:hypothetical protein MC885_014301 [Smutsia gigantea]